MDADVSVVESGGKTDFEYGNDDDMHFPPAHVDRALHDGDTVTLGGVTLTAYLTAGHTKGTTTWTLDEVDNGRTLHTVIVGSPNVNRGYKLLNNPKFPNIAAAYKRGFQVLKGLPCDLFLGSHGDYYRLAAKYPRFKNGDKNAFIDPTGYKAWVAEREQAFAKELARQSSSIN
jgi:metallo-beta-lactamase class B